MRRTTMTQKTTNPDRYLMAQAIVFTTEGLLLLPMSSMADWWTVANHWQAIKDFIETGDEMGLASVQDLQVAGHDLETGDFELYMKFDEKWRNDWNRGQETRARKELEEQRAKLRQALAQREKLQQTQTDAA
jgi:hypothetical protein